MRKQLICNIVIFFLFIIFLTGIADNIPINPVPLSTILQNLQEQGYAAIDEVKFKNNVYEIKTLNAEAKETKIFVDATSGKIIKPKQVMPLLTMIEVSERVEKNGYHTIYTIKFEHRKYKINALDRNNKKVAIDVDAKTGTISLQYFLRKNK